MAGGQGTGGRPTPSRAASTRPAGRHRTGRRGSGAGVHPTKVAVMRHCAGGGVRVGGRLQGRPSASRSTPRHRRAGRVAQVRSSRVLVHVPSRPQGPRRRPWPRAILARPPRARRRPPGPGCHCRDRARAGRCRQRCALRSAPARPGDAHRGAVHGVVIQAHLEEGPDGVDRHRVEGPVHPVACGQVWFITSPRGRLIPPASAVGWAARSLPCGKMETHLDNRTYGVAPKNPSARKTFAEHTGDRRCPKAPACRKQFRT